jgi:phage-related protein
MTETPFDKKIDKAVDGVGGVVKDVAKGINHATDHVAAAVVEVAKGVGKAVDAVADAVVDVVGGKPAVHNPDVDPTTKLGK